MAIKIVEIKNIAKRSLVEVAAVIRRSNEPAAENTKFVNLAPTDKADKDGVYAGALTFATNDPDVLNIALTGPYGSGKSSIIKAFLKKYDRKVLQISLAAFLPEADRVANSTKQNEPKSGGAAKGVTKQEIERSILQQLLYGADSDNLPFSRFKKIKYPKRLSFFVSLYILVGLLSSWVVLPKIQQIIDGSYFFKNENIQFANIIWLIFTITFIWSVLHRGYIRSFGVFLTSISQNGIEIVSNSEHQESILNRHLDEIVYFFQTTEYDLVVIEDLDRFDEPDIFVTLREINSIINSNASVKRKIRFLYALRDDMFINTDRTKFFEFIIPVIPIINSWNSIDKLLEQGQRISLVNDLDDQFIREASRYIDDMRLIRNIFNEYIVYAENILADGGTGLNVNKLLAVIIYKNVFPRDFEDLHHRQGVFAAILSKRDELIRMSELDYKLRITELEQKIDNAVDQAPVDLIELRQIYIMTMLEALPPFVGSIRFGPAGPISVNALSTYEDFDSLVGLTNIAYVDVHSRQHGVDISNDRKIAALSKDYFERKSEIERKSTEFITKTKRDIRELRLEMSNLRKTKFHLLLQRNSQEIEGIFDTFNEKKHLARYLVFEGYLDDTYYQYTSLFHSGRLSPSDWQYLTLIRGHTCPDPEFEIHNAKEVVVGMRSEDFEQNYVLNVKIVDQLLSDPVSYRTQLASMFRFMSASFDECGTFFSSYYNTGRNVAGLISELIKAWPGFVTAAISNSDSASHAARLLAHGTDSEFQKLNKEHADFSAFVSSNLPQILAEEVSFNHDRLKVLEIRTVELKELEAHTKVVRQLIAEGLYDLSIENVEFIFENLFENSDFSSLRRKHFTTLRATQDQPLLSKIESEFEKYLENILLELDDNSDEDTSAILAVIKHEDISIEFLEAFLEKQSTSLPVLADTPPRLHSLLLQLEKIVPTWENCRTYISSPNYDADTLTRYLNSDDVCSDLCLTAVPGDERSSKLRKFLIENEHLEDHVYQMYVRELPREFRKIPDNIGKTKIQILINERKIIFSPENVFTLSDDEDLQVSFVAKNIVTYLADESRYSLDDYFREKLLNASISDEQRYEIIRLMDLSGIESSPSLAATIGSIVSRTEGDLSIFDAITSRALILHSSPIAVQISLLNKFHHILDDQQVKEILPLLPKPYSDIEPGNGSIRIEGTGPNLQLLSWLKSRELISSWSDGSWLDDRLRVHLKRKWN